MDDGFGANFHLDTMKTMETDQENHFDKIRWQRKKQTNVTKTSGSTE